MNRYEEIAEFLEGAAKTAEAMADLELESESTEHLSALGFWIALGDIAKDKQEELVKAFKERVKQ